MNGGCAVLNNLFIFFLFFTIHSLGRRKKITHNESVAHAASISTNRPQFRGIHGKRHGTKGRDEAHSPRQGGSLCKRREDTEGVDHVTTVTRPAIGRFAELKGVA